MTKYLFDRVYLGDTSPRHLHVTGMCDHREQRLATQSELLLPECGQCQDTLHDRGLTAHRVAVQQCQHNMVGGCDRCEDDQ